MNITKTIQVTCDVLIIGGGGAALRAAIEAEELGAKVAVVSKSKIGYGNNTIISAGIFAATGWGDAKDDHQVHLKDTVKGGRWLNDQALVSLAVKESTAQVPFLEKCGVQFYKKDGALRLGHTPGHTNPRHISTVQRDGRGLILPLREYAENCYIDLHDQVFITCLFVENNRILGAAGISNDGKFLVFKAKTVILATGGYAHVYQKTNNAIGITGDGHVLAKNIGVPLKDMEFVQFYPTSLGKSGGRTLLYEAIVATLGAKIKNAQGEDILAKHGMTERIQMTRDRVTRAVMEEILAGRDVEGGVVLDLSPVNPIQKLKPLLPESWSTEQTELIVAPTTHFCMGGIVVDNNLETTVNGLYGAGEICAGVHGANRLGGNALAEVFALGGVAARNAVAASKNMEFPEIPTEQLHAEKDRLNYCFRKGTYPQKEVRDTLRETMWYKAGIIRNGKELKQALDEIERLKEQSREVSVRSPEGLMSFLELTNMLTLSETICQTACMRTESRGAHFRSDYPAEDNDNWLKNIVVHADKTETLPISMEKVPLDTNQPEK